MTRKTSAPPDSPPSAKRKAKAVDPIGTLSSSLMFSPASFGAVLRARAQGSVAHEATEIAKHPVVAFYGFRGGSGRTTALAHVAVTLATKGRAVVVIDLDLEAPGLSTVLRAGEIAEGLGSLALLRVAEQVDGSDDDGLRIAPHLVASGPGLPALQILPAGKLGATYQNHLDLLNPSLWHVMEGPSPLHLLLDRIRQEISPDLILLDCRTGFAPLSAAAIFHEADIVVACLPATRQSHDGARTMIDTLRAAQSRRTGRPAALLVPTMFVESDEGFARRGELVAVLKTAIEKTAPSMSVEDLDDPDLFDDPIRVVEAGVPFRSSLSVSDGVTDRHDLVAGGVYQPLMRDLDDLLATEAAVAPAIPLDRKAVLEELGEVVQGLDFAENVAVDDVERWFLEPSSLHALLKPAIFYVVGAKGSGKSWLYKRMVAAKTPLDDTQRFLRGHGPDAEGQQDPEFTPEVLRHLDRQLRRRDGFEAAFWRLRASAVLLRELAETDRRHALGIFTKAERKILGPLSDSAERLAEVIPEAFKTDGIGPLSEKLIQRLDEVLMERPGGRRAVLVYDGLDNGFGSAPKDLERRERFVRGLVDALEGLRGHLRGIGFKVLLREDVFSDLEVQNKSHLDTAKVDLVWRPQDTWKLALNVAVRSKAYKAWVDAHDPALDLRKLPDDEARLVGLLGPLWGDRLERNSKNRTANYVARRTTDGQGRLFPRTLVQLLRAAIKAQQDLGKILADRVLSSAALKQGFKNASDQRLDDLKAEYGEVSRYLAALTGMNPTATRTQIRTIMRNKISRRRTSKRPVMGAEPGTLHAGPGGWNKVVDRLVEIGVLGDYSAMGKKGEPKFAVALLYRPALGVKLVGA